MRTLLFSFCLAALSLSAGCNGCNTPSQKATPESGAKAPTAPEGGAPEAKPAAKPAPTGPRTAMELIPSNAAAGIAIRNAEELRKKGDALYKAIDAPDELRFSALFEEIFREMKLGTGRDETKPAAMIIGDMSDVKETGFAFLNAIPEYMLYAVAIADIDSALPNASPDDRKALTAGEPVITETNTARLDRGHLLVAGPVFSNADTTEEHRAALLERMRTGETVATVLDDSAPDADVVIHLSPARWGGIAEDIFDDISKAGRDARGLREALAELKMLIGELRVADGLEMTFTAMFKAGGTVSKVLDEARAGSKTPPDFKGLPNEVPLFAFAARGDGTKNRALFETGLMAMASFFMDVGNSREVNEIRDHVFELWGNLNGSRGAVYLGPEQIPAVVLVLDTDSAPPAQERIEKLVQFAFRDLPDVRKLMKVVKTKGQVVVHVGARPDLLDVTLELLEHEKPGLDGNAVIQSTRKRFPGSAQLQVLFSVESLAALAQTGKATLPKSLSALTMALASDRTRIDAVMSLPDLKAAAASSL